MTSDLHLKYIFIYIADIQNRRVHILSEYSSVEPRWAVRVITVTETEDETGDRGGKIISFKKKKRKEKKAICMDFTDGGKRS